MEGSVTSDRAGWKVRPKPKLGQSFSAPDAKSGIVQARLFVEKPRDEALRAS